MSFHIVHNDIVRMKTDAIVNAANPALLAGSGVCGAIFHAAGCDELSAECRQKAPCPTGQSVLTSAYRASPLYYPYRWPVWQGGEQGKGTSGILLFCSSRQLWPGCRPISLSLSLCFFSIFGLSHLGSLRCCLPGPARTFLQCHDMDVYLVVLDRSGYSSSAVI